MDRVLSQFEDVLPLPTSAPGAAAWTAWEPDGGRLYLSDVPAGFGGDNPPSNIRLMDLGAAIDHGLMN